MSNGPWTFEKDGDKRIVDAKGHAIMCDTQYYPWCPDDDEDWYLIGAAHDLLEVVKAMAEFDGRNNNAALKEMARAALEKASIPGARGS